MSSSGRDTKTVKKVRRPLTAYNLYFHDERQKIQARFVKITGQRPPYTHISKLVGASWRKIKPDVKAHYEALAVKDKRRYALDLLRVKQQEEWEETEDPVDGNEAHPDCASGGDSDKSQVSGPTVAQYGRAPACAPPGIDPSSISYQAMLRQSLNASTMNQSDFLNLNNPQMLAQMTMLSAMMIEYVRKVAPERLVNMQGLPAGALQSSFASKSHGFNNKETAQAPPEAFEHSNQTWAV